MAGLPGIPEPEGQSGASPAESQTIHSMERRLRGAAPNF